MDMGILDSLASSQFSYAAGTAGTVTVPAGVVVTSLGAHVTGSGATLTITPKGPMQTGTAGAAIPLPPGGWFGLSFLGELGPGTVLVFAGTDSYVVFFAKMEG